MSILILTVARIDPPRPGGKKSKIIGVDGETIYAYPDKAQKFVVGRAYKVDYSTSEWNGKPINNLESFTESQAAPLRMVPQATSTANVMPSGRADKDEQIFVMCTLKEFIRAGAVDNNQQALIREIEMLRGAYRAGFLGEGNTFLASEAGRVASHR